MEGAVARALKRRPAVLVGAISQDRRHATAGGSIARDALVEIGSVTKVFTATLLADAVVRQEVRLDTPVADLLPSGTTVPSSDGVPITLEHLATHRSGLPRSPAGVGTVTGSWRMLRGRNPYAGFGTEELLGGLARTRLKRTPGTGKPAYSNTGASLLGTALAHAAGTSYDELVAERVCRPLGLHDTVTERTVGPEQRSRWVSGTRGRGRTVEDWSSEGIVAAGLLRSTVDDMLAFLQVQLDPTGSPLEAAVRLTQEPRIGTGRSRQCLGWMHDAGAPWMWWHNGGTGGFRSLVGFAPDVRAATVVLTPSARGVDMVGLGLLRGLM